MPDHSRKRGAAPGGLCPDFLRQMMGDGAAHQLREPVGGWPGSSPHAGLHWGARGTALRKVSQQGGDDVRPVCAGEAVRRLVRQGPLEVGAQGAAPHSVGSGGAASTGPSVASGSQPRSTPSAVGLR